MGNWIGNRSIAAAAHHPYVKPCECQRNRSIGHSDRRAIVFNVLRILFTPGIRNAHVEYIFDFFCVIFDLVNSRCNETCNDLRFQPGKLSETEKQSIRTYFLDFMELFTATDNFQQEWQAREILSGMVLFRVDILPIFLEEIDVDDQRIRPFLMKMLHFEGIIRSKISGKAINGYLNNYEGRLSKEIENEHKWWQDNFIDTEDLNATGEYELTD